ncbi:fatty acid desaturase [Tabrizicola sp. BL-A-41-H6]|uniref:fatty acid desaturase n=1 Tax=Tabrizicola sp. BL-A-41-H6 TaxID=3421107 RepID=UPI003D67EBFD
MKSERPPVEWPTLILLVATYSVWMLATTVIWDFMPVLGLIAATLAIAQFSSLQHEVLHGHPFRSQRLSEATVFPGLTVFVPYLRFKDLHIQHHFDPNLTDPYDDPESNFHDPAEWARRSGLSKLIYRINNTLAGRMALGPALSTWALLRDDARAIRAGNRRVAFGWLLHVPGVALVAGWLWAVGSMPVWAYLLAAYMGWSLLKIRTFLEHRAHDAARARTVVIESRGPLSLLFLNNNFHAVHHSQPGVAWYRLPALYRANREHYLRRNDGYVFRNYAEIFRQFLFRAKDPVPHPIWPVRKTEGGSTDAAEGRNVGGIVEERNAGLFVPAE